MSASEVPFVYLDRPYYLAPVSKGEKVYALLREVLIKKERIGLARVVIQTKQHLAAVAPVGPGLVLDLLRWGEDVRSWSELMLPPQGASATKLTERELAMAAQLVDELTTKFKPEDYRDPFKAQVLALVDKKVKAGDTEAVIQPEEEPPGKSADIIDLTELLPRSLLGGGSKEGRASAEKQAPERARSAARGRVAPTTSDKPARRKRAA